MDSKICNTCKELKPLSAFDISFSGQNATMGFTQNESRKHRCRACYALRDRIRAKLRFISMYGGKCACCGEDDPRFLSLDHIASDGSTHRKELADNQIMAQAITEYQPARFQILCYNCNCGRSANKGVCPHKDKTREEWIAWTDKLLESRYGNPNPHPRLRTPQQLINSLSPEELQKLIDKYSGKK